MKDLALEFMQVHLFAKEYGWTLEEIGRLTPLQMRVLLECMKIENEEIKKEIEKEKRKSGLR